MIAGSLDDLDPTKLAKFQAMVRAFQQLTGDASITTVEIEEGSIRLILEGSEEGIEQLKQLFAEGALTEVLDIPTRAVEPIEFDVLDTGEVREDRLKALLISTIRSQGAREADLSGADLSGADLSGADLSGADLSGADLRNSIALDIALDIDLARARTRALDLYRALDLDFTRDRALDLYRALDLDRALDLYGDRDIALACDIARALDIDLYRALDLDRALARDIARALYRALALALDFYRARARANFSGADFSGADFSGADFSGADFTGAIVENAYFGKGIGLSESEKRDLQQQGAIFDEATGDREFVLR